MASKLKKKKETQQELKILFEVKWKYVSGERGRDCPDNGTTLMEAVTAEEAERLWKISHCYAQRKFKVLSVTEASNNKTKQPIKSSHVGTSKEHGEWDDIPDF